MGNRVRIRTWFKTQNRKHILNFWWRGRNNGWSTRRTRWRRWAPECSLYKNNLVNALSTLPCRPSLYSLPVLSRLPSTVLPLAQHVGLHPTKQHGCAPSHLTMVNTIAVQTTERSAFLNIVLIVIDVNSYYGSNGLFGSKFLRLVVE